MKVRRIKLGKKLTYTPIPADATDDDLDALIAAWTQASKADLVEALEAKYNQIHDTHGRFAAGGGVPGGASLVTLSHGLEASAAAHDATVTGHMQSIVATIDQGSSLDGLKNRLKSRESMLSKITNDSRDKQITPQEAAAGIKDALRYTITAKTGVYTTSAQRALDLLRAKNYTIARLRNTWTTPGYKALNVIVQTPDKYKFELQFQTPESVTVKKTAHGYYEKLRDMTAGSQAALALQKQVEDVYATLPIPENAGTIKAGLGYQYYGYFDDTDTLKTIYRLTLNINGYAIKVEAKTTGDWSDAWKALEMIYSDPDIRPITQDAAQDTGVKYNQFHDDQGRFASSGEYGYSSFDAKARGNIEASLATYGVTLDSMEQRGAAIMDASKHNLYLVYYWKQAGTFADDQSWYDRAHMMAGALSTRFGVTPEQAAGILASVSPRMAWDKVTAAGQMTKPNVTTAYTILKMVKNDTPVTITPAMVEKFSHYDKTGKYGAETNWPELVGKTVKPSSLNARQLGFVLAPFVRSFPENNTKGVRIARGEDPKKVLGGAKVRSFYNNIVDPKFPHSVTIDTWMVRLLTGKNDYNTEQLAKILAGKQAGQLKGVGSYPGFVEAITRVAKQYNVVPSEAQAIMWASGRR